MLAWSVYCRQCSHAIFANSAQFFTPPFRRIRAPGPRISVNFTLAITLGLSAICSVRKRFPNTKSHPPTRAPQSTTIYYHPSPRHTDGHAPVEDLGTYPSFQDLQKSPRRLRTQDADSRTSGMLFTWSSSHVQPCTRRMVATCLTARLRLPPLMRRRRADLLPSVA
ncbi:hypothetical protein K466DRAFT_308565 [Polyporus arcularius HHB13444]|uniref:Uncharacterized protein n=1 Tax=Polyporus arcularius HHB13444 TaxID=1314778 RepID=A0A5C3NZK9_9APHY|nr:hypothetical protein K466DRAFT_308565 [Polyporus arcularius HHB13444]